MPKTFSIGSRTIGEGQPCFIVAEMSGNHMQDYNRALKIIDAAAEAGADAIKLQTYTPDTITLNSDKEYFQVKTDNKWSGQTLHSLYQTAYTPWDWHQKLKTYAEKKGLIFFSTPFDETAVDFLQKLKVSLYKVAGYEFTDVPLLLKIAKTKKPVIASVGHHDLSQIKLCLSTLRRAGARDIALLHCVTTYLTNPDPSILNLAFIRDIQKRFGVIVGFSDNNAGIDQGLTAVLAGASILEKHLTLRRKDGGPDADFSLEPEEFKAMVTKIRQAEAAMGRARYSHKQPEYYHKFHRSLFVAQDIKEGQAFNRKNVRSVRPGHGLETQYLDKIIGKKATRDIEAGTPLSWKLVSKK